MLIIAQTCFERNKIFILLRSCKRVRRQARRDHAKIFSSTLPSKMKIRRNLRRERRTALNAGRSEKMKAPT